MSNEIGAKLSVRAYLESKSIKGLTKEVEESLKAIEDKCNLKVDFGKLDELDAVIKSLGSNVRGINLEAVIGDFIQEINGMDAKQQVAQIDNLIESFKTLNKLGAGKEFKNLNADQLRDYLDIVQEIATAKKDINEIIKGGSFEDLSKQLSGFDSNDLENNAAALLDYIKTFKAFKKQFSNLKNITEDQRAVFEQQENIFKQTLAGNDLAKIIDKNVTDAFKQVEKTDKPLKVKVEPDFEGFEDEVNKKLDGFDFSKKVKIIPDIDESTQNKSTDNSDPNKDLGKNEDGVTIKKVKIVPDFENFKGEADSGLEKIELIPKEVDIVPKVEGFKEKVNADIDQIELSPKEVNIIPNFDGFKGKIDESDLNAIKGLTDLFKNAKVSGKSATNIGSFIENLGKIHDNIKDFKADDATAISNFINGIKTSKPNIDNIQDLALNLSELKIAIDNFNGKAVTDINKLLEGSKVITATNATNVNELAEALENLRRKLDKIDDGYNPGENSFLNEVKELVKYSQELKALAYVLRSNDEGGSESSSSSDDSLEEKIKKEKERLENIKKSEEALTETIQKNKDAVDSAAESWENYLQKISKVQEVSKTSIDKKTGELVKTTTTKIADNNGLSIEYDDSETYIKETKSLQGLTSEYKKYADAKKYLEEIEKKYSEDSRSIKFQKAIDNLEESISKAKNQLAKGKTEDISDGFSKATEVVAKYVAEIKNMSAAEKGANSLSQQKLLSKIYDWMNKNTKGAKQYRTELEAIASTIKTLGVDADLNFLETKFKEITNSVAEHGNLGKSFADQVKDQLTSKTASLITSYLSIQDIIRYSQQAFNVISDLDYELLDLKKTTTMTNDELESFYKESSSIAGQMGVTTKEIISQAAAWSRLGYSSKDAAENMAKLSSEFATISPGMGTEEAQTGLVSIMKAWDVPVENVEREIMDNINVLGNNFAETNADIVDGMKRSASALAATGTSYKDAFALFTGGQEILQNAESMGTALRTISLRIRGYSEESTDDNLELDDSLKNINGDLINLTKTAQNMQGISVFTDETKNLPDAEKKYKSLVEYLGEISDAWDTFSDKQQNDLLQELFGKTRANAGAALITNYDQVREALEQMEDAAGSSEKELAVATDTISAHINKLQTVWIGLLQNFADRDAIKGAIDVLTDLSSILAKILETPVGAAAGFTGVVVAIKSIMDAANGKENTLTKFFDGIRNITGKAGKDDFSGLTDILNSIVIDKYAESLDGLTESEARAKLAVTKLSEEQKKQVLQQAIATDLVKENTVANNTNTVSNGTKSASETSDTKTKAENIAATKVDTATTNENTVANNANATSNKAASIARAANIGIMAASVAAIAFMVASYQKEKKSVEDLSSSMEELTNSYHTNKKEASDNISSVQSLYKEYEELASGVDANGNNVGLSEENYSKYNDLTNQIADKMPTLVKGWTDQGNAILACKDNVSALNKEIEREQKKVYTDVTDREDDILENYRNIVNGHHSWAYNTPGTEAQKKQLQYAQNYIKELKKIVSSQSRKDNSFDNYEYALNHPNSGNRFGASKQAEESARIATSISSKWDAVLGQLESNGVDTSKYDIKADTIDSWDDLYNVITKIEKEATNASSEIEKQEAKAVSGIQNLADAYLHLNENYSKMSDGMTNGISTMISNLTADDIAQLGLDGDDAIEKFVNEVVDACNNDTRVGSALTNLFSIDKDIPISQAEAYVKVYKKAVLDALKNSNLNEETKKYLQTLLDLGDVDWTTDETKQVKEASEQAINFDYNKARSKISGLTQQKQAMQNDGVDTSEIDKEIEAQRVLLDSANDARDVIINAFKSIDTEAGRQKFLQVLNDIATQLGIDTDKVQEFVRSWDKIDTSTNSVGFNLTNFSSTVESLEKITTAYNTFKEKLQNDKTGIDLSSSIKDIEALRAEFDDLDNIDFGDFKSFDDIEKVLTSGTASAKEMQSAFDQLATSLITAKLEEADYSKEEQDLIVTQLRQAGVTKESAQAYVDAISAIANAKKYLADNGIELSDITEDEIKQIVNEGDVSKETANGIMQLVAQEIAAGNTSLNTESSCNALLLLAEYCGVAVDSINDLKKALGGTAQSMATANITGMGGAGSDVTEKVSDESIKTSEQARQYNIKLAADRIMQEAKKKMAEASASLSLDGAPSTKSGGSGGGGGGSSKSDTDEYLEKYKTQYERLKKYRDDDKISEYDYLQYLRALYENYFKDKKKYAEQYEEYEHEYLEGMKTLYENVFTYLSGRIDKQISKLNDAKSKAGSAIDAEKTAATDSLKAQKKAAVDAIEAQIKAIKKQQDAIQDQVDAYQEQIDAINDANDAREREIALQKALYDLDKLQNQRTNLVYSESQGMHYEADLSGIRDARDSVDDAKNDIEIANIQKKIDLLEKQKDLLDDEIDKLEEQKDAIEDYYDNLIDETEAYYDKLKEDMEAAYDKQIELLEKQKDKFSDLKDFVDNIDVASALSRLTGEDANQILQDLMNGNFDAIDKLISGYMDYVGKLKEGNQDFLNGMKDLAGIDVKALTDPIEATSKAFDGIDKASIDITESLDSMVNAFADLPNKIDVANLFGDNSAVTAKIKESGTKLGEEYIGNLSTFLYSDEAKSKIDISKLFENIGSDVNMTSAAEAIGEPFIEAAKVKIAELANQPATAEAIAEAVKNATVTGTTTGVTTAMDSEEVSSAVSTGIDTIANTISQDGKSAKSFKTLGQSLGQAIGEGLNAAFSEDSTSDSANTFVTTFCDKIKEAFAGNNIADILGVGDDNVFEQFISSLTAVIDQLGDIDTTPLVNLTSQFQDLQKAATDTASAIGGNGTTAQTMPTTGATGEANGAGNQNAAATTTGNSDSLVGAITALGSTADEVLGEGGEDGDGSGIVGQFQAMQKAVEETAIAIGSGDSEGSGKKGGDDSGVGLIAALEAEKEVTFDEEQGLPKQIELWGKLEGGIQNCVDAVKRLIDGLSQLEEFSLSVNFAGFSVPAGAELGSEATGTVTFGGYAFADGTNVGLESDQRALVGEVGEESLVRNGRFSLIGRNGAQFMDLKKGDIIFSHSQTKQLMKTGRINGRGKTVGNRAYADGTPLNKAFKFAGQDTTASNLSKLSAMLTGFVDTTNAAIEPINKVAQSIANSVPNVSNSNSSQSMTISIGDIHLSGVQNPDGLAQAIKSYLPGKLLQELHK